MKTYIRLLFGPDKAARAQFLTDENGRPLKSYLPNSSFDTIKEDARKLFNSHECEYGEPIVEKS